MCVRQVSVSTLSDIRIKSVQDIENEVRSDTLLLLSFWFLLYKKLVSLYSCKTWFWNNVGDFYFEICVCIAVFLCGWADLNDRLFLCSITTRLQWKNWQRRESVRRSPESSFFHQIIVVFFQWSVKSHLEMMILMFWSCIRSFSHWFWLLSFSLSLFLVWVCWTWRIFCIQTHYVHVFIYIYYSFACFYETLTGESKCFSTEICMLCYFKRPKRFWAVVGI